MKTDNTNENNSSPLVVNGNFLQQLFKDKNNCYSLREVVIAILVLAIIISWIAKQFFQKDVPEFMFYSFASLVAAGCFGYSLEKKTINSD
jgi:choline-glycine betaine transporter